MLTGTSTRADAVAQFRANLLYEEDATGTKARALIEAARFLATTPFRSKHPNATESELSSSDIAQIRKEAEAWLASRPTSLPGLPAGSSLPRQFSFERIQR